MLDVQVPIFDVLDRLDSQVIEGIHLESSPLYSSRSFLVHLLPTRNVESNHVRSILDLHCDAAFRRLVKEMRPTSVVEVGTHLGGRAWELRIHDLRSFFQRFFHDFSLETVDFQVARSDFRVGFSGRTMVAQAASSTP